MVVNKEIGLTRDELVREIVEKALKVLEVPADFNKNAQEEIETFVELSAEKYDSKVGGRKGNIILTSFDGRYRIRRAVSDRLEFDERLQAAKSLIDECIKEWTEGSRSEIRALIDNAFQVGKAGRINAKRILGLRRLNIHDQKWQRAMDAISDSLQVTGSRTYLRIYERDELGGYHQLAMDMNCP